FLQPREDDLQRDATRIVTLQPRENRLGHLLRLGSREDKFDMRRRLFEGLQQRVEGLVGELMSLVDDVNLEAIARGPVAEILDDRAGVIDLTIGGTVDFGN